MPGMKKILYISLLVVATISAFNLCKRLLLMKNPDTESNNALSATKMTDYPVKHGVSAPFAAIADNLLIVAGGCNFPDKPPYEGGQKVFYSSIYFIDLSEEVSNQKWIHAGEMPFTAAYGSAVATKDGILCIGGQNNNGAMADVMIISIDRFTSKASCLTLPSIPSAVFNAGAATIGNKAYITGGSIADGQVNYIFELDLENIDAGWKRIITNQSHERQQPVVFTAGGELFAAGGYDENIPEAFTNIDKFDFESSAWIKVASSEINNQKRAMVGSGVAALSSESVIIAGGVDYDRFMSALNRLKRLREATAAADTTQIADLKQAGVEYMTQPVEWYRFATSLVRFDASSDSITVVGNSSSAARAGAGIAYHKGNLYIIGGETKPGVRSEEANCIALE